MSKNYIKKFVFDLGGVVINAVFFLIASIL